MDLMSFLREMENKGYLNTLANNPLVQFGPPERPYLGATLLPERMVNENFYTETGIRMTTVVALDGPRYGPAQLRQSGQLVGSFDVKLADQDIAREFTGRDYDAFLDVLRNGGGNMEAAARIIFGFVDQAITRALVERTEIARWQALENAAIVRVGDNGYTDTISYPNPTNHRAAAGGVWSNNSYDPFPDILAMVDLIRSKGFQVNRIITSRVVKNILLGNSLMAERFGSFRDVGGTVYLGRMSEAQLDAGFQIERLPAIETYDNTYRDETGVHRFMSENKMIFLATTGRDETIGWAGGDRFLPDTLGYTAIGRAVGQQAPGRVVKLFPFDNKPPRLEAEGWQTSLPVLMDPEAVAVITGIS